MRERGGQTPEIASWTFGFWRVIPWGETSPIPKPMARRRSGLQPMHLAGAVAFLALAGGAWWLFAREKGEKMEGNPFSGTQFAANKIVRGNTYVITGTILRQLRFDGDSARLFAVEVKEDGAADPVPVPVLVPPEFSGMNIQVGQEFQISVLVDKNGVPVAKDIRKT